MKRNRPWWLLLGLAVRHGVLKSPRCLAHLPQQTRIRWLEQCDETKWRAPQIKLFYRPSLTTGRKILLACARIVLSSGVWLANQATEAATAHSVSHRQP